MSFGRSSSAGVASNGMIGKKCGKGGLKLHITKYIFSKRIEFISFATWENFKFD